MAAQELRGVAASETLDPGDVDRQEAIYREREAELTARHPNEFIVICGDEVFVGRTFDEAESRAQAAHPGRPFFSSTLHPPVGQGEDPGIGGDSQRAADAGDAAFEEDLARQREAFEAREDELLAKNPGRSIAVCAGDVFVADDDGGAISMAEAAHPDRAIYLCSYDPLFPCRCEQDGAAEGRQRGRETEADAAFEEDLARQREAFEAREDELLAKNPGRSIAVCAGDVFVADDDGGAISMAEAAHPDRAIYLCSYDPLFPCRCEQDGAAEGRQRGRETEADAAFEKDLARQGEIFEAREDELLAKNPGRSIAVCAGDVFVADDDGGAISMAEAAHPDRAIYLCSNDQFLATRW